MKGEVTREPHFFTAPEWVNRQGPVLSDWPLRKKKSGDRSRVKSVQHARVSALLRRLEKDGLL